MRGWNWQRSPEMVKTRDWRKRGRNWKKRIFMKAGVEFDPLFFFFHFWESRGGNAAAAAKVRTWKLRSS